MTLYFDIETEAAPREVLEIVKPFDESGPDLSRCSSEATIKKKIKEFEANKDQLREEHYAKVEDRAALNPLTNRVLAVAFQWHDADPWIEARDSELETLEYAWAHIGLAASRGERVVGYNIKSFDLPILLARSIVCGVAATEYMKGMRVFDRFGKMANCFLDLALTWQSNQYRGPDMPGFAALCALLGIPVKTQGWKGDEFAHYWKTDREAAEQYAIEEVVALEQLHKRMCLTLGGDLKDESY